MGSVNVVVVVAVIILTFTVFINTTEAKISYVNETGSCTSESPSFMDNTTPIQIAVDNVNAGDSMKIQPGNYMGNIVVEKSTNIIRDGIHSDIVIAATEIKTPMENSMPGFQIFAAIFCLLAVAIRHRKR